MITAYLLQVLFGAIGVVTFFLPVVTVLPLGVDSAFVTFMAVIKAVTEYIPLLSTPLTLFILIVTIEFLLFSWEWVKWIISVIRG